MAKDAEAKTYTNYTRGPRGINLVGGGTRWLDPGESVDLKDDQIAGMLPDLGSESDEKTMADQGDEIAALKAENADLKALLAEKDQQIADLTKPAGK